MRMAKGGAYHKDCVKDDKEVLMIEAITLWYLGSFPHDDDCGDDESRGGGGGWRGWWGWCLVGGERGEGALLGQRDEKEPLFGRSRGSPSRRLHSMGPVRLSLITNSLSDTNTMPTHTTTPIKCCWIWSWWYPSIQCNVLRCATSIMQPSHMVNFF